MGVVIGLLMRGLLSGLVAMFSGWKAFFAFLLVSILGVVIYNLVVDLVEEVGAWIIAQVASAVEGVSISSGIIQLSGLGAWMGDLLRVPELVAMAVAFILLKWTLVKIPFIKW